VRPMACVASCMPPSTRGIYREVVSGAFDENDSHGLGHPNPDRVELNTVPVRFESIVCEGRFFVSSVGWLLGSRFSPPQFEQGPNSPQLKCSLWGTGTLEMVFPIVSTR
jgi:hypothetical protein